MKKYLSILFLFFFINGKGQITFESVIGGIGSASVFQTKDLGYIIANSNSIIRLNNVGDTLWSESFNGLLFIDCIETADTNYVAIGQTSSFGAGSVDIIMIRLDSVGNIMWTKTYGGNKYDIAYSLKETLDRGFIFCGETLSYPYYLADSMHSNSYLIKTDAAGDTLWTKSFGGYISDGANDVIQNPDSSYIVVGWISSYIPNGLEIFISKFSPSGNRMWSKYMGTPLYDYGVSISRTLDGGYILSCIAFVVKLSSQCTFIWSKSYCVTGEGGYRIVQTPDSGYILYNNVGINPDTVNLIKINAVGDTLWTRCYPGWFNDIQTSNDGGYICLGNTHVAGGGGYIVKTDSLGFSCNQFNRPTILSTPVVQTSAAIPIDVRSGAQITNPQLIVTGGLAMNNLCFYDQVESLQQDKLIIELFPNPASSTFTIQINSNLQNADLEIFNLTGEKIYSGAFSNQLTFDCEQFPAGIYFVKLQTEKGSVVEKLVIQK